MSRVQQTSISTFRITRSKLHFLRCHILQYSNVIWYRMIVWCAWYSVLVELFVSMSKRFLLLNDLATSVKEQTELFYGLSGWLKVTKWIILLGTNLPYFRLKVIVAVLELCEKGWSLGSEAITRFARDFVAMTTAAQPKRRKFQTRPGGKTISLEICQRFHWTCISC